MQYKQHEIINKVQEFHKTVLWGVQKKFSQKFLSTLFLRLLDKSSAWGVH